MKHLHRQAAWLLALWLLLGIKNGYLAVWKDGDPQPLWVLPCPAGSLPPSDQILLRKGLYAADLGELTALLEDYL